MNRGTCINIHTNGSNDADDKKKGQLEEDLCVDVFLQLAALGPRPTVVEKCLCLVTWWVDIVNRLVEFTQAYCYNEWFYEVSMLQYAIRNAGGWAKLELDPMFA